MPPLRTRAASPTAPPPISRALQGVDNAALSLAKPFYGYGAAVVAPPPRSLAECEARHAKSPPRPSSPCTAPFPSLLRLRPAPPPHPSTPQARCCREPTCHSVTWLGQSQTCTAMLTIAHGARPTDWRAPPLRRALFAREARPEGPQALPAPRHAHGRPAPRECAGRQARPCLRLRCWRPKLVSSAVTSIRLPGAWERGATAAAGRILGAQTLLRSGASNASGPRVYRKRGRWTSPSGHAHPLERSIEPVACGAGAGSNAVEVSDLVIAAIPVGDPRPNKPRGRAELPGCPASFLSQVHPNAGKAYPTS